MRVLKILKTSFEKDASVLGDMTRGAFAFAKKHPVGVISTTLGAIGAGTLITGAAKHILPTFLILDQSRKNEAMDYQTMLLRNIANSVERTPAPQPVVSQQIPLIQPLS